jgi:hypothetical protein
MRSWRLSLAGARLSKIMPDLVANREIMTTHQIDIDVEPAQIVWSKRELEVDERKSGLESQAKSDVQGCG